MRVDTHLEAGCDIPPYYDSLIAKLVVYGRTREECIARAKRALAEFHIEGVATTISFHLAAMDVPAYAQGEFCTDFVEKEMGGV